MTIEEQRHGAGALLNAHALLGCDVLLDQTGLAAPDVDSPVLGELHHIYARM